MSKREAMTIEEIAERLQPLIEKLRVEGVWHIRYVHYKGIDVESGEKMLGHPERLMIELLHIPSRLKGRTFVIRGQFDVICRRNAKEAVLGVARVCARQRAEMARVIKTNGLVAKAARTAAERAAAEMEFVNN